MMPNSIAAKILFSVAGTAFVLWDLLKPGYVLTLDMVFGPRSGLSFLDGWMVQKLCLVLLFFFLFFLPLTYFKKIFGLSESHGSEYVAALFFALNPFVYERFLAGQWQLVLGYALLFPAAAYLVEFCRERSLATTIKLCCCVLLLSFVSVHVCVMYACIMIASVVARFTYLFACGRHSLSFLKQSALLIVILSISFACYSRWVSPAYIADSVGMLNSFDKSHWDAFATASGLYASPSTFGTLSSVLSLHGFWLEGEAWSKGFYFPFSESGAHIPTFIPFILLVIIGFFAGVFGKMKNREIRSVSISLALVLISAVIFSAGVAETPFKGMNYWLFDHVYFWRGFRDTQKWSAVIALVYALYSGIGAYYILGKIQEKSDRKIGRAAEWGSIRRSVLYVLMAIPLAYTPMMLFGFSGQLETTQYPESWRRVDSVLRESPGCKALFLPWHLYYSLPFNDNLLTANVSGKYFHCDIIHGKNMEFGGIDTKGGFGKEYESLEIAITSNDRDPGHISDTVRKMKDSGINYIIFTNDIVLEDRYTYPFLNSSSLEEVFNNGEVALYKIL